LSAAPYNQPSIIVSFLKILDIVHLGFFFPEFLPLHYGLLCFWKSPSKLAASIFFELSSKPITAASNFSGQAFEFSGLLPRVSIPARLPSFPDGPPTSLGCVLCPLIIPFDGPLPCHQSFPRGPPSFVGYPQYGGVTNNVTIIKLAL
jgi:hypothetical protein